jgi:hypothetical protein
MPGLIRGVARTAAVVGTATAVSGRVQRRQQGRWAAQDQAAAPQPDPPAPPPESPSFAEAPPAVDTDTKISQLKELAALKDSGVLTDAEFAAEKAKILDL